MTTGGTSIYWMGLSPMFCEYPLPLPLSERKISLDKALRL